MSEWRTIDTAPRDGTMVLLYRPLAEATHDPIIAMRRTTSAPQHVWKATIPSGVRRPKNYTAGSCYATHWMPLPEPPEAA